MCRFVALLSKTQVRLDDLIYRPENSLIKQSMHAQESFYEVNADGFGVALYHRKINREPVVIKSIQPAWNEPNLMNIMNKVASNCLVAHIRAATHGSVDYNNCHPFAYKQFSFVHNGSIAEFSRIKRALCNKLTNDRYAWIKGLTDTEHFAALFFDHLYDTDDPDDVENMLIAVRHALHDLNDLFESHKITEPSHINLNITNGESMLVVRFTNDPEGKATSLYYAAGENFEYHDEGYRLPRSKKNFGAVVIASERLTDDANSDWSEVPVNHALLISPDLSVKITAL